ncbi:pyridoxamine 5'-phosphate oxidase family protein [Streptomyces sp. NBC_01795]|uniref:pyridoxamine 5'-phosphate oxidase family protein n=1 Tax=unclassified Streptomyces TaxID=2593676 RepID=UPI002DD94721|nr:MULTISPECIES: pyridoxamine 5'-phosphate oxidase family protein [unclassified Streptomyces]WSA94315.1 pyridoxamine 5'-phosphate oxidase family protein [Streptomyces sp. NBC_01795]WSB78732.1 pyridoxamine 5'-phosphate oxidase family protein [Streptomyces sp. NBC_01775]WSS13064.1 pyridoxamine 5'-phosphate oxidase family protein [Streptomyces sp. NBC_01186]
MNARMPETALDRRYSEPEAEAVPWPQAEKALAEAELYWCTTVRPDGRPHMTPLIGIWGDGALHFTTGPEERKARNLARNPHCVLAVGDGRYGAGLDLAVEGEAVRVTDLARLAALAEAWVAKYGEEWRFAVRDEAFWHEGGGHAHVFAVAPDAVFGFGKSPFSQTRWRF